jgi:hypothetical protein
MSHLTQQTINLGIVRESPGKNKSIAIESTIDLTEEDCDKGIIVFYLSTGKMHCKVQLDESSYEDARFWHVVTVKKILRKEKVALPVHTTYKIPLTHYNSTDVSELNLFGTVMDLSMNGMMFSSIELMMLGDEARGFLVAGSKCYEVDFQIIATCNDREDTRYAFHNNDQFSYRAKFTSARKSDLKKVLSYALSKKGG